MNPHYHPAWITINLTQFKRNIQALRQRLGKRLLCLPVKANAYGHGLLQVAQAADAVHVDYLGVSCLQEGMILREGGVTLPIFVFGAIHEDQISDLIHLNLEVSVSSKYKADLIAEKCSILNKKCRVHIEIDSGMHRTGVRCSSALDLYQHLKRLACFEIIGIYSHFAKADDPHDPFNQEQIEQFLKAVAVIKKNQPNIISHMANSSGLIYYPQAHLDMLRPGLITFGYGQEDWTKPCFSLKSKISYFKVLEKGQGISYGHTYVTDKRTRIVTIPLGYGDGFRRALSNKGSVLIRNKRYPIVGNICMDQFMVDIGHGEAYVGDEVVLIGKQGNETIHLEEVADLCDTIPYEILCGFNTRLPIVYSDH